MKILYEIKNGFIYNPKFTVTMLVGLNLKKDIMLHEARQTFIHVEAKKLRERLKIEMDTPTSFFIVKEILDRYDDSSKFIQPNVVNSDCYSRGQSKINKTN